MDSRTVPDNARGHRAVIAPDLLIKPVAVALGTTVWHRAAKAAGPVTKPLAYERVKYVLLGFKFTRLSPALDARISGSQVLQKSQ